MEEEEERREKTLKGGNNKLDKGGVRSGEGTLVILKYSCVINLNDQAVEIGKR